MSNYFGNRYDVERDDSERDENRHFMAEVAQDADQFTSEIQESDEVIVIKDSGNIHVHTTETQAALSLQLALQLALTLVIRISIADSDDSDSVAQELLQHFDSEQKNVQKIHIENSKDVNIKTNDTDIAASLQVMLEALLAIVARLDIG
jgi:spore coat protein X